MSMATTTSLHNTTIIRTINPSTKHLLFAAHPHPYLPLPRVPPSLPLICLARRRGNSPIQPNNKKKDLKRDSADADDDEEEDEDDLGEDALNEDDLDDDVVDAIFELFDDEDLAMLEDELEEEEEGEDGIDDSDDSDEDEDSEDDEEDSSKIKGWQLRRLAYALKFGKRKVGIKDLAAELCLDRAVVLEMLRNPPPKLLMLSAALPDTPEPCVAESESDSETDPSVPSTKSVASKEPVNTEAEEKTPIHVLQGSWSANKRLKKVQLGTLQKVYRHSKRPTDAMISSITQVTNLPRSRIVKWFEERRAADGLPERRSPYIRSSSDQSESVSKVS